MVQVSASFVCKIRTQCVDTNPLPLVCASRHCPTPCAMAIAGLACCLKVDPVSYPLSQRVAYCVLVPQGDVPRALPGSTSRIAVCPTWAPGAGRPDGPHACPSAALAYSLPALSCLHCTILRHCASVAASMVRWAALAYASIDYCRVVRFVYRRRCPAFRVRCL